MKGFKTAICFLAWSIPFLSFCFEKLDEKYLIQFGDSQAKVQLTQYFTLSCPHCLSLFKKEFKTIKDTYIDTKQLLWIFHPIPLDISTIQFMDCLSKLNKNEKAIFLDALLDTLIIHDHSEVALFLMKEAMKTFQKPIQELGEDNYLVKTEAFIDAFKFIKQEDRVDAVPTVEINGILYRKEVPDLNFLEEQIELRKGETSNE